MEIPVNSVQLYFAIGIPMSSVLAGIAIGTFQSNHVLTWINLQFTSLENRLTGLEYRMTALENRLEARMSVIESDVRAIVRILGDMDSRIARLQERTAR